MKFIHVTILVLALIVLASASIARRSLEFEEVEEEVEEEVPSSSLKECRKCVQPGNQGWCQISQLQGMCLPGSQNAASDPTSYCYGGRAPREQVEGWAWSDRDCSTVSSTCPAFSMFMRNLSA